MKDGSYSKCMKYFLKLHKRKRKNQFEFYGKLLLILIKKKRKIGTKKAVSFKSDWPMIFSRLNI